MSKNRFRTRGKRREDNSMCLVRNFDSKDLCDMARTQIVCLCGTPFLDIQPLAPCMTSALYMMPASVDPAVRGPIGVLDLDSIYLYTYKTLRKSLHGPLRRRLPSNMPKSHSEPHSAAAGGKGHWDIHALPRIRFRP